MILHNVLRTAAIYVQMLPFGFIFVRKETNSTPIHIQSDFEKLKPFVCHKLENNNLTFDSNQQHLYNPKF